MLTAQLGKLVIDQTDLRGLFDIDLKSSVVGVDFRPTVPNRPAPDLPIVFTALREQLGLELRADKADVQTMIFTRVEMPDPD
jgi:uncharacterized protein (TIGR03435 family)